MDRCSVLKLLIATEGGRFPFITEQVRHLPNRLYSQCLPCQGHYIQLFSMWESNHGHQEALAQTLPEDTTLRSACQLTKDKRNDRGLDCQGLSAISP